MTVKLSKPEQVARIKTGYHAHGLHRTQQLVDGPVQRST